MTTSPKTLVLSDISGAAPLPDGTKEYLRQRVRQAFFSSVREKLATAERAGLKRSDLARRMGKGKANLSHLLAMPGNWTLDTYTDLLVHISQEEPVPSSKPYAGRAKSNHGPIVLRDPSPAPVKLDVSPPGANSGSQSYIVELR
ncbi:hypothetical protein ACLBX9_28780 [Methylobacterium sp. A49B]